MFRYYVIKLIGISFIEKRKENNWKKNILVIYF